MNNDLTNLMEQDFEQTLASSVEKVDDGGLNTVASLARQIRDQEKSIAELDIQLKEKKKSLLKLTDEDLPSVLAEMGISSFSLDDGSTVDVKNTYGASILVDNRPKAYDWLRENGYDDIIKNTVSSSFGRGEDDRANAFTAFAQKEGYFVNQKTEIHPQTLRAFIKERCEAGDDFPMDLFGAYIGQRAVIKGSK